MLVPVDNKAATNCIWKAGGRIRVVQIRRFWGNSEASSPRRFLCRNVEHSTFLESIVVCLFRFLPCTGPLAVWRFLLGLCRPVVAFLVVVGDPSI